MESVGLTRTSVPSAVLVSIPVLQKQSKKFKARLHGGRDESPGLFRNLRSSGWIKHKKGEMGSRSYLYNIFLIAKLVYQPSCRYMRIAYKSFFIRYFPKTSGFGKVPLDLYKKAGFRPLSWQFVPKLPAFLGKLIIFTILIFIPAILAFGNEDILPLIKRLDVRDVMFKQFSDDVTLGRRAVFQSAAARAENIARRLTLYRYTPTADDDFFRIAARCNIPYDAIATLNRLSSVPVFHGKSLILPSIPGIFIPEDAESDFEKLILSGRGSDAGAAVSVNLPEGKLHFRFIPGDILTPNERAFFLNPGLFRFPLQKFTLTSAFGQRVSPISGRRSIHSGLDLAAPAGTEVYAARSGVVIETSENSVYGKYVVIAHDDGWTSLYGHLSSIDTGLRNQVKTGTFIGKVGSTGLSTGPHLHFELRQNGKAKDPVRLLSETVSKHQF
jgi:murein DD-endopeptidase MepM/ murein hydrolase activator NlpD